LLGYKVECASSGKEALKRMKKRPFDLVILDMIMEPGMNGRETYEEIIKLHPNQKAIIASGFSASEEVKKSMALGAGQYVKKPYLLKQLGGAVKTELGKLEAINRIV
jgi:DNA-binding NtrC family response regulator